MKTIRTVAFAIFAFTIFSWNSAVNAQLKIDCESVSERVKTAIEAKPNQVLTVVEDALVAYSGCVDAIVKTAIETSKADAAMVKQIVLVAVTTAEDDAPQIAESAVAAAPDHADAVREAFAEAFEKKASKESSTASATAEKMEKVEKEAEQKVVAQTPASTKPKTAVAESTELSGDSGETVKISSIPDQPRTQVSQSMPSETTEGKAVIGEVSGKSVVADYDEDGTTVIYEGGKNYLRQDGKSVVYESGKEVAQGYDSNPSVGPGSAQTGGGFSYGPVDLAGVYLIPPVASASPVQEVEEIERVKIVTRFVPKRRNIIRSVPMSPTAP